VNRRISVILPTYNERGNIVELIGSIQGVSRDAGLSAEIVVVDDDSPDGTWALVEKLSRDSGEMRVIRRVGERGLATAIRRGIREASGDVVVVMDTDFNHDPIHIPALVRSLDGHDIAVGSRYVPGGGMEGSTLRYWGSYAFNLFIRLVLGVKTSDNLSGFFAARREFLSGFPLDAIFQGYGDYFIRLLHAAEERGSSVLEIPVRYALRPTGQSKTRFIRHTVEYTRTVFSVRFGGNRRS
jgi:dolichol-phosphate mannosyltransferase